VTLAWIAVVVLALGVGFLGLVLAGAVRRLDELRREVEELRRAPAIPPDLVHPGGGLPVGSAAPSFDATLEGGGTFSSSDLRGSPHLVVFADPTCEACDALVPELLAAATAAEIPPTLVVGASGAAWPAGWAPGQDTQDRVGVVRDDGGRIARAFASELSPHVFVVDAGGSITAQGPAGTLADVRELLRDAEGIEVIAGDAGP
jgi:AhpC/TSA family